MSSHKRLATVFALLTIASLMLVACQPQATGTPQVIIQTEIVEVAGTPEVREVVVTATPEPEQAVTFTDPNPDTYTTLTFGDIDTMDPNLAYDTASAGLIINVMETLIFFNHKDATTYVPLLAEEVPSLENGGISEDGMTYTFTIRDGISFHNGNPLTASDFAYTFQRGLLQSDPNGPQWLLIEPLLGEGLHDVTQLVDAEGTYEGDPAALAGADPAALVAACEQVKAAIVADDDARTLTFNLAQPWGPFLATLAQSWGAAIDQEWAIENGAWNGECDTWQNHYAPGAENDELSRIINGTGPYMLDHWTPGEEYVLVANPNYWRADGDAMWEGGPSGAPRIQTVVTRLVDEWGTRFASLQAGDAESVTVNPENRPQVDEFVGEICDWRTDECTPSENPDAPLRMWADLPSVSRTDVFLNFNVATDEQGNNPYIGSGALDGNGIPADFFSDLDVRKAMAHCFDYEAYIADALNGEGVRNNGPIILDMLGYNPEGPMYEFNLDLCAEHLATAWGGVLPDVGFRFQVAFNTGNTTRQTVAEIFQANLASINELYRVETVGLPWPTLLRSFRARQLPVAVSGWIEDIHDPHNWVQPYTVGTFAGRQNMAPELQAQFAELVNAGVAAVDEAEREQTYFELQQLFYDQVPTIILAQATGRRYEQRWVQGWYYNPLLFAGYYYAYSLDGGSAGQ